MGGMVTATSFLDRDYYIFCFNNTIDISRMIDLDTEELLEFPRLLRSPTPEDENERSM
jgi:hypothetical protein